MTGKPPLNHLLGAERGRSTRLNRADQWAWSIVEALKTIAGEHRLSELTNDQLAELIRVEPFNIAAPRGGELTGKVLHVALDRLGISNALVKRWRKQASRYAAEINENPSLIVFQLWHEWKRHEALNDARGLSLTERAEHRFKPRLVEPVDWVPPWVRDPRPGLALPRLATLALSMGLFEPSAAEWLEEVERGKGEDMRRDAGEGAHFDDATDYAAYLASIG